jgi:aspartate/methionine/tyrosine aminotransferase
LKFPINHHIENVLFPPIVEIKRLVVGDTTTGGLPYVDLCQAIPDYPPAPDVVSYLQGKLPDDATSLYTADEGMIAVRQAVCRRYERVYGAQIAPENICLTMGASQAFWLAMVTLCTAGDEIIIQAPTYFDYDMALRMQGIGCVYAPFNEEYAGIPDVAILERLVTSQTKAILLVSPCNPTGMVIPPEVISAVYELAKKREIALVIDETYADFIAAGKRPHHLFETQNWCDHLVHIMSFGKSYAMTGYRAGILAGSEIFINQALKCHDTMAICQSTPTQIALGYALDNLDTWVATNRIMMERRHDRFKSEFCDDINGFKLITSGAFFAWVKHPFPERSAWQVAQGLIQQAGLITLPGEIFGPGLSRYLRVAFGNIKEDMIREAVSRFRLYPQN